MFKHLRIQSIEKAILPYKYINRFGIKEKSKLDDKTLRMFKKSFALPSTSSGCTDLSNGEKLMV
jgi:hypothetical protein